MPFIRDWQFNWHSTTTATTVTCKLPQYQQNDLLLAILSTDTGTTQAWSSSGWTQLFSVSNISNLGILYKIAGASESDPTFTYTISETANVHLIAIGDVNTTTPFNGTGGAGTGYRTASNSAARVAMPVLTTTVNNSLILYINSESGVVVAGVLEGPCTWEDAMDGSAHSHGWSWGFQATAGAVGGSTYGNKSGTAAGVIATVGISPPSGGATVIPTYCAADASIYVDPIHGTTAYNGNTGFAATVTTNFGTTLNGCTLSNGTAAGAADMGLNSFHSMGQITGVTTDGTYAGACTVLATGNKPNVTGKNVIAHTMPSTPKVYQNLDNIAKATSKGVAFGMASSAGNFKFWAVHGFGTKWDTAQHVPIIINESAPAIDTTGSFSASSVATFGWAISGTLAAPAMRFGSLWVLDTTTVCGGNSSYPVQVPGIVRAAAKGKERMSVLQQGATQMLVLQPIQFGNGGTDPIYLDLSNSAVEFPQQRSVADGQVFYNSVDNVCGLTFYPGASDTIDIRNAVFSSKSKFKWDWHSSMSTSATVYTTGAQVINAGTLNLQAITYDQMAFTNCLTITQNSATITGSKFKNCKVTSATLADMDNISNCAFTSGGTGHAIEVSGSASTITFTGNTFTGYASSNGSTGNEAIYVNISSGTVTINITNGGSTPSIRTAGATVVVQNAVTLTVTVKDASTGAAIENARVLVEKTSDGTDVLTGLTNSSGVVTTSYAYVSDTAVTGTVRRATAAYGTLYKPGSISGTITSSGFSATVLLNSDE
jgi:hypothetical protein